MELLQTLISSVLLTLCAISTQRTLAYNLNTLNATFFRPPFENVGDINFGFSVTFLAPLQASAQ